MAKDILETKYDAGVLKGMRITVDALNNMIHNGELIIKHPFGPLDPEMVIDVDRLGVSGDYWKEANLEIFWKEGDEDGERENPEGDTTEETVGSSDQG